jgi:hypothetical protein
MIRGNDLCSTWIFVSVVWFDGFCLASKMSNKRSGFLNYQELEQAAFEWRMVL